ncbi:MAG: N-acetylmuramoyl-L-alanine amidase family protein [bacterium]
MYDKKSIIRITFISILLFLSFPLKAQELDTPKLDTHSIVLDAGHGGKDLGCSGATGTMEKDFTLDLTLRLHMFFEQQSTIKVLLTRNTDETVSLHKRGSFANSNQADIFISLHANAAFNKSVEGLYIYYYEDQEMNWAKGPTDRVAQYWERRQFPYIQESKRLAECIAEEARLSNIWTRVSVKTLPIPILEYLSMPAVLIETEFISSPRGESKLLNTSEKQKMTECFYRGIIRYFE